MSWSGRRSAPEILIRMDHAFFFLGEAVIRVAQAERRSGQQTRLCLTGVGRELNRKNNTVQNKKIKKKKKRGAVVPRGLECRRQSECDLVDNLLILPSRSSALSISQHSITVDKGKS